MALTQNIPAKQPARVFVTIPRFEKGIPVTLGTVSDINTHNGPLIAPYPNYEWHKSYGKNCDAITSVFRIMVSLNLFCLNKEKS